MVPCARALKYGHSDHWGAKLKEVVWSESVESIGLLNQHTQYRFVGGNRCNTPRILLPLIIGASKTSITASRAKNKKPLELFQLLYVIDEFLIKQCEVVSKEFSKIVDATLRCITDKRFFFR